MHALNWGICILLTLLGCGVSLLCISTFASMGTDAPLWLRTLGSLETAMSQQIGIASIPPFTRALSLTILSSLIFGTAAFIKPRYLPQPKLEPEPLATPIDISF